MEQLGELLQEATLVDVLERGFGRRDGLGNFGGQRRWPTRMGVGHFGDAVVDQQLA
jgi:hypothetical protein